MKVLTFFLALLALASGASAYTHILLTNDNSVYDYSLDPESSPALVFPSLKSNCQGRHGFNLNGSLVILGGSYTTDIVKVVPHPDTAQPAEVIGSMNEKRWVYSAVQLDEFRVWFAGGFIASTSYVTKTGYVYDVRTNGFSQLDLLDKASLQVMVQISTNETLVCARRMGSRFCGKGCDIYNWSNHSWSQTGDMPECSDGAATGVITLPAPDCRRVVIVVGGNDDNGYVNTTRLYDIEKGVWSTSKHSLPERFITNAAGVVVDQTRFILFGGVDFVYKKVYEYKHDSGWERLRDMPSSFQYCALIKYNYP